MPPFLVCKLSFAKLWWNFLVTICNMHPIVLSLISPLLIVILTKVSWLNPYQSHNLLSHKLWNFYRLITHVDNLLFSWNIFALEFCPLVDTAELYPLVGTEEPGISKSWSYICFESVFFHLPVQRCWQLTKIVVHAVVQLLAACVIVQSWHGVK